MVWSCHLDSNNDTKRGKAFNLKKGTLDPISSALSFFFFFFFSCLSFFSFCLCRLFLVSCRPCLLYSFFTHSSFLHTNHSRIHTHPSSLQFNCSRSFFLFLPFIPFPHIPSSSPFLLSPVGHWILIPALVILPVSTLASFCPFPTPKTPQCFPCCVVIPGREITTAHRPRPRLLQSLLFHHPHPHVLLLSGLLPLPLRPPTLLRPNHPFRWHSSEQQSARPTNSERKVSRSMQVMAWETDI